MKLDPQISDYVTVPAAPVLKRTYKSAGLAEFAKLVTEDGDDVNMEEKRSDCYYNSGLAYGRIRCIVVFCATHLADLAAARSFKFSELATFCST